MNTSFKDSYYVVLKPGMTFRDLEDLGLNILERGEGWAVGHGWYEATVVIPRDKIKASKDVCYIRTSTLQKRMIF